MDRWSSGLRHTLGKRAMLTASGGSNPLLSANRNLNRASRFRLFFAQYITIFCYMKKHIAMLKISGQTKFLILYLTHKNTKNYILFDICLSLLYKLISGGDFLWI